MAKGRNGQRRIEVWIGEAELDEIKRAAAHYGVSLSAWVRAAAVSAAKASGATHADVVVERATGGYAVAARQQRSEDERLRLIADELEALVGTTVVSRTDDGRQASDPGGIEAGAQRQIIALFYRLMELVEEHEVTGHVSEEEMAYTESVKALAYELRKLGTNVNQIARHLNSEPSATEMRGADGVVVTGADLSALVALRERLDAFLASEVAGGES